MGTTKNQVILSNFDDLEFGSSYLSIYSITKPSYSVLTTNGNLDISPTFSEPAVTFNVEVYMTDGGNVAGPFVFKITVINLPPSIITPFQDITLDVGTTGNQIIFSNFNDPESGSS